MRSDFLIGAVGQGLNSFMDSYLQAKDITRRQAQADDEMAMRKRQQEREDFTSGVKWDPETKSYTSSDNTGFLTRNEQKQMSGLLEAQKAAGENWFRNDYAPYRTALSRLMMRSLGNERGPDTAQAQPGGTSMPAPQTRQGLIQQTEALGKIPSVPTSRPQAKGLMAPQSPYAPLKSKVMGRHAPGYNPSEWAPGYAPKAEKEQQQKNQSDLLNIEMKETEQSNQKLPASDALKLSEAAAFPKMFNQLEESIKKHEGVMGPFQGLIKGNNPYNTEAQQFQSEIGAVAQRVGKYLEGGVLRAEDVPKYAKMLPQMTDTPEVARAKLGNVKRLIQQKMDADRQGLATAGYRLGDAPGDSKNGPAVGAIEDGYVFLGGDPADQKSWRKK